MIVSTHQQPLNFDLSSSHPITITFPLQYVQTILSYFCSYYPIRLFMQSRYNNSSLKFMSFNVTTPMCLTLGNIRSQNPKSVAENILVVVLADDAAVESPVSPDADLNSLILLHDGALCCRKFHHRLPAALADIDHWTCLGQLQIVDESIQAARFAFLLL